MAIKHTKLFRILNSFPFWALQLKRKLNQATHFAVAGQNCTDKAKMHRDDLVPTVSKN